MAGGAHPLQQQPTLGVNDDYNNTTVRRNVVQKLRVDIDSGRSVLVNNIKELD